MSHPGPHRASSSRPSSATTRGRGVVDDAQHASGGSSLRRDHGQAPPTVRYGGRSVARHGRLSVTSPARSIAKGFTLVASVVALTMVILGSVVAVKLGVDLGFQPTIDDTPPPPLAQLEGGANVLVIGSDDRTGQGAEFGEGTDEASGVLNDVNILFHLSEDQTHATAVSIPRDTIIDTPQCTNDKGATIEPMEGVAFNSILHEGGMGCVVAAAEKLSGLDIQYAAMVQFRGVIEMSNAVGGVEVCVANEISDDYVGLYLDPGFHTLQGADALKFLRSRHGVGDGSDIARISNQQVFLSALMRTVKSADTLTNPAKLYGLATAVTRNMTLSSSLDIDTIMGFASALARVPTENIVFAQLPVADSWQAGRVEPLEPDADQMWELLRQDKPIAVAPQNTAPTEPNTPGEEPPPSDAPATGDPGASTPGATAPGVPATPSPTVPGQNASDETCSNAAH